MDKTTSKLLIIGFITVICFIASMLVLGLGEQRHERKEVARKEVGSTWGSSQTITGPLLVLKQPSADPAVPQTTQYVLPKKLKIQSTLTPEIRIRGIFETVVYTEVLKVSGTFSGDDVRALMIDGVEPPQLSVGITDTRSIERQVALNWNTSDILFAPGAQSTLLQDSGIHTQVPIDATTEEYPFSLELALKGSERAAFVPLGDETEVSVSSTWASPSFIGAFLPTERTLSEKGFDATWRISSFGRNYPHSWKEDGSVTTATLQGSSFGVDLTEGVDLYTQVSRSVTYAILFIVITFAAFFLFETLSQVRIHPVQYLLVGFALTLFYLLLLSLSEHIGFLWAYLVASGMTIALITGYSVSVLKARSKAALLCAILAVLYGYLYFVLQLEDQALLFGALLLFVLLAITMYLTRTIDWFSASTTYTN